MTADASAPAEDPGGTAQGSAGAAVAGDSAVAGAASGAAEADLGAEAEALLEATAADMAETASDLQDELMGGEPRFTRMEVAELTGAPMERARMLWRSMGYPDSGEEVAFTQADVDALRLMLQVMAEHDLDDVTATDLVRSMGQSASRLAEWQVNSVLNRLIHTGRIPASGALPEKALRTLSEELAGLAPAFEHLLVYAWRRQVGSAIERMADVDAGPPLDGETTVMSVGFADMVGFTRLSRRLPNDELAMLVSRFEAVSADVVAARGGRVVKTVGDEILFVTPTAKKAANVATDLHQTHASDDTVPEMRIGIATGNVVSRMGDVFGTTVNLASRLTAMARPGSTLVDQETRQILGSAKRFSLRGQPPRPVRGLGMVRPYVLNLAGRKK